jgi:hypothetical protein
MGPHYQTRAAFFFFWSNIHLSSHHRLDRHGGRLSVNLVGDLVRAHQDFKPHWSERVKTVFSSRSMMLGD